MREARRFVLDVMDTEPRQSDNRVAPGPAHQHQPPDPYGRTQLPAPQTTPTSEGELMTRARRQQPVDSPLACYYAADLATRPRCTLTASVQLGAVMLCASCNTLRSTLGKGQRPVPLPAGPRFNVLGWVTTAHQQAGAAEATHPGRRRHQSPPSWSILDGHRGPPRRVTSRRTTTLHAPTDISSQEGLDNHPNSGVETPHGPHLGNYVIVTPGELRDRHPWGIT